MFGKSMLAADELQVYVLVGMCFLGAALASWRGCHLRMDLLANALPSRVRKCSHVLELLLEGGLLSYVAVLSTIYAIRIFRLGTVSDMAGLPMWVPHSMVAIGFFAMALVAFWRLRKSHRVQ
jgi:TRAP-type C4-dicarboxylate transport system permease small subunit